MVASALDRKGCERGTGFRLDVVVATKQEGGVCKVLLEIVGVRFRNVRGADVCEVCPQPIKCLRCTRFRRHLSVRRGPWIHK